MATRAELEWRADCLASRMDSLAAERADAKKVVPPPSRQEVFRRLSAGATKGYGSMLPRDIVNDLMRTYQDMKNEDPQLVVLRVIAWKKGEAA